jgi:hypothetical protein
MPNLVEVNYEQTGKSTNTDALGSGSVRLNRYFVNFGVFCGQ